MLGLILNIVGCRSTNIPQNFKDEFTRERAYNFSEIPEQYGSDSSRSTLSFCAASSQYINNCKLKPESCKKCCQEIYRMCTNIENFKDNQLLSEDSIQIIGHSELVETKFTNDRCEIQKHPRSIQFVVRQYGTHTGVVATGNIGGAVQSKEIIANLAEFCQKKLSSCNSSCP
jgi:hypothetical protein